MTAHLTGKFVWFEHASSDTAKARAFYEPLFGWHVESMPMGEQSYSMILVGEQGIGGFTTAPAGGPAAWQSYLSVADVDERHRAALAAGARSVMPPTDFGPVGRGAALVDPTGAAVSLWRSAEADRPDTDATPVGEWIWNELWTPDAKRAVAFYEGLAGYAVEAMDIGQESPYYLLNAGGKGRGGIFQARPGMPTQWVPYVHVSDCDATLARATQMGATVCMPPMEIEGVGRFAALVDPQGATIAVLKPAPM